MQNLRPEQAASYRRDSTDERLPTLGNHNQSTINRRLGKKQRELEWIDISCLIIHKMIGGGIFVSSGMVVLLTGSKWAALLMWAFGSCYSFASILIYLEYGLAWPFIGGEYIYASKILPRPSIVAQCSFAWFFVCFSTSAGNAITFTRFVGFAASPDHGMNAWLQKVVGCWVIVGICFLHYRFVSIGILANNLLAVFKVVVLLLFSLLGLLGGLPKEGHTNWGIPGASDFGDLKEVIRTPANSAVAMFLVLYSYEGWENADYVAAKIKGNDDEKRKTLKKGTLIAVAVVSFLYIFLNVVIFLVLSLDDILRQQQFTVVYDLVLKSLGSQHTRSAKIGVSVTVALNAVGNLIGDIPINARVKREISNDRLIPFSEFFAMSSNHGRLREDIGTPTGGLILHGLVSCIFTTAVPFLPDSLEGFTFIINTYTYGHSILNLTLAFGVLFPILVYRMNAYSTATVDNALFFRTQRPWSWQILRSGPIRQICAGFLILVNSFLVILPFLPNVYTDGTPRKIPTWKLPVTSFPAYAAGAVAGFIIAFISETMNFHNSHVVAGSVIQKNFVIPARRRWKIGYPEFGTYWQSIHDRGGIRATISETKMRLFDRGEAQTAREINQATGGPVHEPMHVWNVFRKWLHSRRMHRGSTVLSPHS